MRRVCPADRLRPSRRRARRKTAPQRGSAPPSHPGGPAGREHSRTGVGAAPPLPSAAAAASRPTAPPSGRSSPPPPLLRRGAPSARPRPPGTAAPRPPESALPAGGSARPVPLRRRRLGRMRRARGFEPTVTPRRLGGGPCPVPRVDRGGWRPEPGAGEGGAGEARRGAAGTVPVTCGRSRDGALPARPQPRSARGSAPRLLRRPRRGRPRSARRCPCRDPAMSRVGRSAGVRQRPLPASSHVPRSSRRGSLPFCLCIFRSLEWRGR